MALAATVPTETVTVTGTKPKPSAAPSTSLGGLENKLIGETNQAEKDITSYQDSVGKLTTDFHQQLSELKSQAPKPPEEKPFTPPQQQNPISAFGSTAGLLAGIASLFSRSPLTASLNAMGAGMKAINEGNATAYQHAFDEWKANTDYSFKIFDAENKQFDSLVGLAKTDYDAAVTGVKTLAQMTDDKPMQTALAMKGIEGVEQLQLERQRLNNEMQSNYAKMIPGQIFNQSLKEFEIKNNRPPAAAEMSDLWQKAQTGSTGMMSTAQMIASYQMAMPSGYALKNMGGDMLVQAVQQLNPGYSAIKYGSIHKAFDNFTSGPNANLLRSGNVVIQHLSLLKGAFDALKNGDVQAFNAAKIRWQQETGSPLPTNYDAVAGIAADELTKFIVGGGRAGGALTDRQDMKATISKKLSQGQGSGVFDEYIGLMAGQMNGLRKQYEADELEQIKPFNAFLLPETQSALMRHDAGGNSPDKQDFSHLWGGN